MLMKLTKGKRTENRESWFDWCQGSFSSLESAFYLQQTLCKIKSENKLDYNEFLATFEY